MHLVVIILTSLLKKGSSFLEMWSRESAKDLEEL